MAPRRAKIFIKPFVETSFPCSHKLRLAQRVMGYYLTIVFTLLLHFTIIGTYSWILNLCDIELRDFVFSPQRLVYISYPLIGLLGDIKLKRYRMIRPSFWVTFVSHLLLLGILLCFVLPYSISNNNALGIVVLIK